MRKFSLNDIEPMKIVFLNTPDKVELTYGNEMWSCYADSPGYWLICVSRKDEKIIFAMEKAG
jgi:hypothetical protein